MVTALQIVNKANEFGFNKCAIVALDCLEGYEEKLQERITRFPETRARLEHLVSLVRLQVRYPWAKAIVVCVFNYGQYNIPDNIQGRIAKYYLTDGRRNPDSACYQASMNLEKYLLEQGLQVATERHFGLVPLRWVAQAGGLGMVRKNNFFYTEKGSWQHLEAFIIDKDLEYIATHNLRPCSDKCNLCINACPTQALCEAYAMNRNSCVSDLTTWSGWDLSVEPLAAKFGDWYYGCDACQDVCPHNKNTWTGEYHFPYLEELSKHISMIQIVQADYEYIKQVVQPMLWYIPPDKIWRYKTNALNAMLNNYREEYLPVIEQACSDECEQVRDMAHWVLGQLRID